jgi:hypothetical protein
MEIFNITVDNVPRTWYNKVVARSYKITRPGDKGGRRMEMKTYGCTIEKDDLGRWTVYGADGFPLYHAKTKRECKEYLAQRIEEKERVTAAWDKEGEEYYKNMKF